MTKETEIEIQPLSQHIGLVILKKQEDYRSMWLDTTPLLPLVTKS